MLVKGLTQLPVAGGFGLDGVALRIGDEPEDGVSALVDVGGFGHFGIVVFEPILVNDFSAPVFHHSDPVGRLIEFNVVY
jgi:hypothetical protein